MIVSTIYGKPNHDKQANGVKALKHFDNNNNNKWESS